MLYGKKYIPLFNKRRFYIKIIIKLINLLYTQLLIIVRKRTVAGLAQSVE